MIYIRKIEEEERQMGTMSCFRRLFLITFFGIWSLSEVHALRKIGSQTNCKEIWYDGEPLKNVTFTMSQEPDGTRMMSWRWASPGLRNRWTVYYKDWPGKAMATGGILLSNEPLVWAKFSWKINNRMLYWTSTYRKATVEKWNGTICNTNISMKLDANKKSFVFHLGEEQMVGGKHGQKKLRESSSLLKSLQADSRPRRMRREIDELDEPSEKEKETTWKKIQRWFKELFNQSDNDERAWYTRLTDWLLGFIERTLS